MKQKTNFEIGVNMPKLVYKDHLPSHEKFEQDLKEAMAAINPIDDLLELARELREFEQKYGMSSEDFYLRYQAGALGDELQHCLEWAATYRIFLKTKRLLESALMRAALQPVLFESESHETAAEIPASIRTEAVT
jgi:hypothetical protein